MAPPSTVLLREVPLHSAVVGGADDGVVDGRERRAFLNAEEPVEEEVAEVEESAEEAPAGYAAKGIWPPPHCKLKVGLPVD